MTMKTKDKISKNSDFRDLRVRVPAVLFDKFCAEAEKERRKYGDQIARIFEDRYAD